MFKYLKKKIKIYNLNEFKNNEGSDIVFFHKPYCPSNKAI